MVEPQVDMFEELGELLPPVLGGIVSLSLIVIVVMLCAKCKEKTRQQEDVQLKEVTTVQQSKKKPSNHANGAVKLPIPGDEEVIEHRHSNGIHDSRPKSHDRALPELPINGAGLMEDDMDPGHYDIIGRGGAKTRHNAYDKIQGEPDTDSGGYAGIPPGGFAGGISSVNAAAAGGKGDVGAEKGVGVAREIVEVDDPKQHSYAVVSNAHIDAEYAQIPERANRPRSTVSGTMATAAATAAGGRSSLEAPSMDTLDGAPPEVPDRNYEEDGGGGGEDDEDDDAVPSSSPLLPPRNSAVMDGVQMNGVTSHMPNGGGMDHAGAAAAEADTVKGPDYTKVTARESLNHIRMRHQAEEAAAKQQQQQLQSIPGASPDYDSVQYDQIKSPGASGAVCAERTSLTSDLYAEIATGSARSSTYARVGELTVSAPTPPPIDTLSRITFPEDVDVPEPGYSQISRRPHSVVSSTGRRSPVYAMVDKSRKAPRPVTMTDPLYSQVNKGNGVAAASGAASGGYIDPPPGGYMDPPYSQVQLPTMTAANKQPGSGAASADMLNLDDPDYDQVQDIGALTVSSISAPISPPEEDEFDPNYAELKETAMVGVESGGMMVRSEPIYQEITEGTML